MRKVLGIIILVLILGIGSWYLVKNRIGDIRPAVIPVQKQEQTAVSGRDLDFPVNHYRWISDKIFADGLGAPRDLELSPKGTMLVSVPSQGNIYALVEDEEKIVPKILIGDLNNPHGLSFYKGKLYVAEETQVSRYKFNEEKIEATLDKVLFELPEGGRHITRSIDFNEKGEMFISIGSTCDVCFEKHPWLGTVIISNEEGKNPQVFSQGLRNAVFIKANPKTQKVWVTEMGRDFLGDEAPPDEINILERGHYGWPVCYGNKVYDKNFNQRTPKFCENTVPPAFEIPAHSAPLGLNFINSGQFPADWQGDLLVAYHGSWNRTVPTGYKVVRMRVSEGKITGAEDFIWGFLKGSTARGRPVDLEFDTQGNLYVSDDKAGAVYIVSKK